MNRAPYEPYRPFARESGALARTEANGDELRVHRDDKGRLHPMRWHVSEWASDGWRCAVPFGYSPEDLVALGAAAMALPVAFEAPAAAREGGP